VIRALSGLAIGVLAGSVPFAWLLHRFVSGRDLRREGSGNPGATNVVRTDGWGWGLMSFALDAGKGAAAVLVAARFAGDGAGAFAALGAVLGHAFTPWLSGRGGRGVAAAAGAFVVVAPIATAEAFAIFVLVVALTRVVSLASVSAALALPVFVALLGLGARRAAIAAAIAAVIAWRHRENFARMRAGTEPRLFGPGPRGKGVSG
jgi:glycerol-3-phosphate acyltransferase PlsY